jgi:hypothetical protein
LEHGQGVVNSRPAEVWQLDCLDWYSLKGSRVKATHPNGPNEGLEDVKPLAKIVVYSDAAGNAKKKK